MPKKKEEHRVEKVGSNEDQSGDGRCIEET
jgi:hypothetical protein